MNWSNISIGTLVIRSAHWVKEHCGHMEGQLGILVGHNWCENECWPIIHWEGEVISSITHPLNVSLYRTGLKR